MAVTQVTQAKGFLLAVTSLLFYIKQSKEAKIITEFSICQYKLFS